MEKESLSSAGLVELPSSNNKKTIIFLSQVLLLHLYLVGKSWHIVLTNAHNFNFGTLSHMEQSYMILFWIFNMHSQNIFSKVRYAKLCVWSSIDFQGPKCLKQILIRKLLVSSIQFSYRRKKKKVILCGSLIKYFQPGLHSWLKFT